MTIPELFEPGQCSKPISRLDYCNCNIFYMGLPLKVPSLNCGGDATGSYKYNSTHNAEDISVCYYYKNRASFRMKYSCLVLCIYILQQKECYYLFRPNNLFFILLFTLFFIQSDTVLRTFEVSLLRKYQILTSSKYLS